jgi:superfamily II DNA helicase RecQ
MKTIATYPPEIIQSFDRLLLKRPTIKKEDSHTLWLIMEYLRTLTYKLKRDPRRALKFVNLERKFRIIYVKIRQQEEEHKAASTNAIKEPFYWHGMPDRKRREVFEKVRRAAKKHHGKRWYTGENEAPE